MNYRMDTDDEVCYSEAFARQGRSSLHLRRVKTAGRHLAKQIGYMFIMKNHEVPVADAVFLQARLDELHVEKPATVDIPWSLPTLRHTCGKRPVWTPAKEYYIVDGEFALIYREAVCEGCGQLARSRYGCAVEVAKYTFVRG